MSLRLSAALAIGVVALNRTLGARNKFHFPDGHEPACKEHPANGTIVTPFNLALSMNGYLIACP
jgi:hypothetical protein